MEKPGGLEEPGGLHGEARRAGGAQSAGGPWRAETFLLILKHLLFFSYHLGSKFIAHHLIN